MQWPESWPKHPLVAIGPSLLPGAGSGLFAIRDIEPGTELGTYEGHKIHSRGIYRYNSDYAVTTVCGRLTVDAQDFNSGPFRMMNDCLTEDHHSVQLRKRRHEIYVVAIRTIRRFEEIYVPYGPGYW